MARPSSSQNLISQYQLQWVQAVNSKEVLPFIFPYALYNYGLLILYLFYARTRLAQRSKYAVFFAIVWLSITTMSRCRTLGLDYGVLVGIASSWCIVWSAILMIFHVPHQTFCRLVKASQKRTRHDMADKMGVEDVDTLALPNPDPSNGSSTSSQILGSSREIRDLELVWEYMPDPFWKRLAWTVDLVTSLRGLHWSWRSSQIPPISHSSVRISKKRPFNAVAWLLFMYLSLDALNIIAKTDPYFWGITDNPSDLGVFHLESYIKISRHCHIFVTFLNFLIANMLIFDTAPLVFVQILGPSLVGTLGEPWMYAFAYGPIQAILDEGLQGFWALWWHQMFRFGCSSPGLWVADRLNIARSSKTAKALRILVAFSLSGIVHACGCYTQWPSTSPLNVFLFFLAQPVGMVAQELVMLAARGLSLKSRNESFHRIGKSIFTVIWLRLTFWLMADEYARGGMWLIEPLPLSPLRCLGFGPTQNGWWRWQGVIPQVYWGDNWWQSGLAI